LKNKQLQVFEQSTIRQTLGKKRVKNLDILVNKIY